MTEYDIWLSRIPEIGSKTILSLREVMGGLPQFSEEFYRMTKEERTAAAFRALEFSGEKSERVVRRKAAYLTAGPGREPAQYLEEMEEQEIRYAVYDDAEYPDKLRYISDPPFGLYYYGHLPSNTHPSAAIVGTRMASAYGRDQARVFAREIAREVVQIISGMALGIDGVAGRGALDADGESFAVLGCGVDICYPKENMDLYGALMERGGILSEYPPGTEPARQFFPSRNRIISGLADVVLVIEAREKSGTLITVDRALEYGIDVFALPGRVSDKNSRGCNALIKQGAGIATCPGDILDYLFGEQAFLFRDSGGEETSDMSCDTSGNALLSSPLSDRYSEDKDPQPSAAGDMDSEEPERGAVQTRPSSLSKLEQAVFETLDESTPQGIDALLPAVRETMGRTVSCQEVMRTITMLTMKDLVQEIRVGNYISKRPERNS